MPERKQPVEEHADGQHQLFPFYHLISGQQCCNRMSARNKTNAANELRYLVATKS